MFCAGVAITQDRPDEICSLINRLLGGGAVYRRGSAPLGALAAGPTSRGSRLAAAQLESARVSSMLRPTRMDLASKRILVTGGAGFLGSHLIALLRARGCRDIVVPRSADCDLVDRTAVQALFAAAR